jgi:hypothetical protein
MIFKSGIVDEEQKLQIGGEKDRVSTEGKFSNALI